MNDEYRIASFSLFSVDDQGNNNFDAIPDWGSINYITGMVTIAPNNPNSIGNYTIFISISTKMPIKAFKGRVGINTDENSADLCLHLISTGYLDTDYFPTSKYVEGVPLALGSSYASNEYQYRLVFLDYYHSAYLRIQINGSLTLSTDNNKLLVKSKSSSKITATIQVTSGILIAAGATSLATISNNGTKMEIIGDLSDVNRALQELLINLVPLQSINGTISIDDQINPILTQNFTNFGRYMNIYTPPVLLYPPFKNNVTTYQMGTFILSLPLDTFIDTNEVAKASLTYRLQFFNGTLQNDLPAFMSYESTRSLLTVRSDPSNIQLNPVTNVFSANYSLRLTATNAGGLNSSYDFTLAIYNSAPRVNKPINSQLSYSSFTSGTTFSFKLASDTFVDSTDSALVYTLSKADGTSVPGWLSFKDMTLSGSPEDGGSMSVKLTLKASNSYQSAEDNFTLEFKASARYVITQIIAWVTSIIGLYGFYGRLPMIYNIFFAKFYKYNKVFMIDAKAPVKPDSIYPIAFIGKMEAEARKFMKLVEKEKLKNPKDKLSNYYFDENLKFNDTQLKSDLSRHLETLNPNKKEILTIIIHDLITLDKISEKGDNYTRDTFNSVKSNSFNFIKFEKSPYDNPMLKFLDSIRLDEKVLFKALCELNSKSSKIHPKPKNLSLQDIENSVKIQVQPFDGNLPPEMKSRIQMPLLQQAIISHFRMTHSIHANANNIKITGGIVSTQNKLLKFLKFDLEQTGEGENLGLGFTTKMDYETMMFEGTPHENFGDQDFVIRIATKANFLLREFTVKASATNNSAKPTIPTNNVAGNKAANPAVTSSTSAPIKAPNTATTSATTAKPTASTNTNTNTNANANTKTTTTTAVKKK